MTAVRVDAAVAAAGAAFADLLVGRHEEAFRTTTSQLGHVLRRPIDIAGPITSWSTPFVLETWKLVPALSFTGETTAGRVVMASAATHLKRRSMELGGKSPVLVFAYADLEALRVANAPPYGVAGYVWTDDLRRAHRVAAGIDAGTMWVNSRNIWDLRTPFGVMKASGVGHEGGERSLDLDTEERTVHVALERVEVPRSGRGGAGGARP